MPSRCDGPSASWSLRGRTHRTFEPDSATYEPSMELNAFDWAVLGLYGLMSIAVGLMVARRAGAGRQEFFLSGRKLPWWLLGVSLVATTFSTDTPNLVTDLVRSGGVSQNWVWWAFAVTGLCTVFFYAKLWRRSAALTDIAFYELRYSGRPAAFLRGFRAIYLGVFFNVMIMASVNLAATKIAGVLLGWDRYTAVIAGSAVTVLRGQRGAVGRGADGLRAVRPGHGGLGRGGRRGTPAAPGGRTLRSDGTSRCHRQARAAAGLQRLEHGGRRLGDSAGGAVVEHLVPWRRARRRRIRGATDAGRAHRAGRHAHHPAVQRAALCAPSVAVDHRRAVLPGGLPQPGRHHAPLPPSRSCHRAQRPGLPGHAGVPATRPARADGGLAGRRVHVHHQHPSQLGRVVRGGGRVPAVRGTGPERAALRGRGPRDDGGAHHPGGSALPVASERVPGVPDHAPGGSGNRAHFPAAVVLVADQRVDRDLRDGHLLRGRAVPPVRPCAGARSAPAHAIRPAGAGCGHHDRGMAGGPLPDRAPR